MIRKLLLSTLAAMTLSGMAALADPALSQAPPGQQSQQARSNGSKSTMQFFLNETTQVNGQVGVGSTATVEYQASESGQLVALSITPQSAR
jgi:hypothetical protein